MQHAQKAKAVILAANGGETPRLLLMSESPRFPDGLANGSGLVGKYLMGNGHSLVHALFAEPLNEYKSVQVTRIVHDFYESDPRRGFYGGGGLDARAFIQASPILFAQTGLPPGSPRWGKAYKDLLRHAFTRHMAVLGSTTSLAHSNLKVWRIAQANEIARANGWTVQYTAVEQRFTYLRPHHAADFGPQLVIGNELRDFAAATGVALVAYSILLMGAYSKPGAVLPPQFAGAEAVERLAR